MTKRFAACLFVLGALSSSLFTSNLVAQEEREAPRRARPPVVRDGLGEEIRGRIVERLETLRGGDQSPQRLLDELHRANERIAELERRLGEQRGPRQGEGEQGGRRQGPRGDRPEQQRQGRDPRGPQAGGRGMALRRGPMLHRGMQMRGMQMRGMPMRGMQMRGQAQRGQGLRGQVQRGMAQRGMAPAPRGQRPDQGRGQQQAPRERIEQLIRRLEELRARLDARNEGRPDARKPDDREPNERKSEERRPERKRARVSA